MRFLFLSTLLLSFSIGDIINLGTWDKQELSKFLSNNKKVKNISDHFLNVPYQSNTMVGSTTTQEKLVIDLEKLDCFTFIDYVEAMKNANNFNEFKTNLIQLRYQSGDVNYTSRNHFLSDWTLYNGFKNITASISPKVKQVTKTLNLSKKGTLFLKGITPKKTTIDYLDSKELTQEIVNKLQTGDYIGIYSHIEGLDVTHVGIFIKKNGQAYFRHASSKKQFLKVVDEPFETYIKNTPGFIVLRKEN